MKINENTETFPPYKYFTDVEEKFLKFTPNCRVLPARYFDESHLHFLLKQRYEPGEHKHFPNGGFEVCDLNGGIYNFDLNEVVVHPYHLNMMKYFSVTQNINKEKISTGVKGKRGRPAKDPSERKVLQEYVPTGGKRGRKQLDPKVKAERKLARLEKQSESSGRRGRPRKAII
jgi:hypothetical protein